MSLVKKLIKGALSPLGGYNGPGEGIVKRDGLLYYRHGPFPDYEATKLTGVPVRKDSARIYRLTLIPSSKAYNHQYKPASKLKASAHG